jgi:hypothetical protein
MLFRVNMSRRGDELHPPEVIDDYVRRNYQGLENAREISIGMVGGRYRVTVVDSQHIIHTLKIDPKEIDADREEQLKIKARAATQKTRDNKVLAQARKINAAFKAMRGRDKDHDRER